MVLLYSGACNFYYRSKGVFLCQVSLRVLWIDLKAEGTQVLRGLQLLLWRRILCSVATRARFDLKLHGQIWRQKVLLYSGACDFYYKGKRCVPLQDLSRSSITRFGRERCSSNPQTTNSTIEVEGIPSVAPRLELSLTWSSISRFGSGRCFCTLELATSTIEVKGGFLCSPERGLTLSSMARFCGRRCSSFLKLATFTIEVKGVFLCAGTTRERSRLELYDHFGRWKVLKYSGACNFYQRDRRCIPFARSHQEFYCQIQQLKVLLYSGACNSYYRGCRCVPLRQCDKSKVSPPVL